jgi:hypothetical protein
LKVPIGFSWFTIPLYEATQNGTMKNRMKLNGPVRMNWLTPEPEIHRVDP